jgi:hypothetical protein
VLWENTNIPVPHQNMMVQEIKSNYRNNDNYMKHISISQKLDGDA